MKLNYFEDINQYYGYVKPYLIQQEGYHNLIFGMMSSLRSQAKSLTRPYLATVEEDDNLVAVAISTLPGKLVLSKSLNFKAFNLIAQDLQARQKLISVVIGPVDEVQAFTKVWQVLTNKSSEKVIKMGVYQLETVKSIHKAKGHFRQATLADRNLLINWYQAHIQAAWEEATDYDQAFDRIENYLKNNALYLWQDEVPVSVAGFTGATPNGIRVNFVYTPPQYRRQGYASSCVAALSQMLLDQGRKYCFLFTDLANPTSNHIYQAIGYQAVGEMQEYWFEDGNLE
jgi:predicted GNAT family acetyltransferase